RQCPHVRICHHLRRLREEYLYHHLSQRFLRFHMRLVHLLLQRRGSGVIFSNGSIFEESLILGLSWAATADLAKMVPFAALSHRPKAAAVPRALRISSSFNGCAKGSIASWHARARSRRTGKRIWWHMR